MASLSVKVGDAPVAGSEAAQGAPYDSIFLEDEDVEREKAEHSRRLNMTLFPLFRALGLGLLLVAVRLHDTFVPNDAEVHSIALLAIGYAAYALVSWAALRRFSSQRRSLTVVFLALDIVAWTFAIHASGAERSWLFVVLLLRPADQIPAGLRRVVGFGLVSIICYVSLMAYVVTVEHRAISWPSELTKTALLALAVLYMVLPTMTARALRERLVGAIRAGRRLIREVDDARSRTEEASRVKSQFMANMSHEVRTPMNGILGMTELALLTPLSADQRACLQRVQQCGDRLMLLLTDLLDFDRIETGAVEARATPLSVKAVLAAVVQAHATEARRKGIDLDSRISPDVPDAVTGDPWAVGQVVRHLTGNAVKFTAQGAVAIEVTVEARAPDSVKLRFAVTDTGVGISDEVGASVFEPFTQADNSSTRRYEGSGLGLTIASRLVHLMGGRLWFESRSGQGTTFYFTLPFGLPEGGTSGA